MAQAISYSHSFSHEIRGADASNRYTWKETGIAAAKVIGGALAFAAVSAATGSLMQVAGARLVASSVGSASSLAQIARLVGTVVTKAGVGVFLAGKYTFLSIAVPIYTVTWVVPKWVVQKGLPQAAQLAYKYAIIPLCNGIMHVAKSLHAVAIKVSQAFFNHVLVPCARFIDRSFIWFAERILIPICKSIAHATEKVAHALFKVANAVYKYAILPAGQFIVRVLEVASKYIAKGFTWVANKIIVPIGNKIIQAMTLLADITVKLAHKIYTFASHILAALAKVSKWVWKSAVMPICNSVVQATEIFAHALLRVAQAVFKYAILPLAKAIKWMWNTTVIPICKGVVQAFATIAYGVQKTAQAVYAYAILPTGQFIARAFEVTFEYAALLRDSIVKAGRELANSVYESYHWFAGRA